MHSVRVLEFNSYSACEGGDLIVGSLDVFGMLDVFDVFCFQLPSPSKFKDSAAFRLQMQDVVGVEKGVRCQEQRRV